MDLGHGFIPRVDARNYKAVERCLTRDGPGLFHEALDLPWAVLEGPWALQHGAATLELCRDRGVSFLVDTQAWRYRDARTFLVDKFTSPPYAPASPLSPSDGAQLRSFVAGDLEAQARLGAGAFLLPGAVPKSAQDEVGDMTLALIDAARPTALAEPRPCIAFVGAHSSAMEQAHTLIDRLPLWLGVCTSRSHRPTRCMTRRRSSSTRSCSCVTLPARVHHPRRAHGRTRAARPRSRDSRD